MLGRVVIFAKHIVIDIVSPRCWYCLRILAVVAIEVVAIVQSLTDNCAGTYVVEPVEPSRHAIARYMATTDNIASHAVCKTLVLICEHVRSCHIGS